MANITYDCCGECDTTTGCGCPDLCGMECDSTGSLLWGSAMYLIGVERAAREFIAALDSEGNDDVALGLREALSNVY